MPKVFCKKLLFSIVFSGCFSMAWAQDFDAQKVNIIRQDTLQQLLPFDTTRARIAQRAEAHVDKCTSDITTEGIPFKNVLRYDFYGTAAALSVINKPEEEEKGNLQFYYNATINNRLNIGKLTWSLFFFNEYGYKKYFDSLGIKSDDNYNYRTNVQWNLFKTKLKLNGNVNVKSQLWKTYQYEPTDSNGLEKIFYSGYFSPGYIMYSGGLAYVTHSDIVFELGMVGGKITKIKNQEIFDTRDSKKLYGLEKGEKRKFDLGLNFVITAPIQELRKNIYWETNTVLFTKNRTAGVLKEYSMDVNNAFHFLFLKHLRLTLRTKIIYDKAIQDQVFVSNQISFGFYLSNKMK